MSEVFTKKDWIDRQSQYPNRRKLTDTTTGTEQIVEVARAEGTVTVAGHPFNAANMNDLENRIDSAVTTLQTNFQSGVDSVYDACVDKGSTPASHSLTDVVEAIGNISGGGSGGGSSAKKWTMPYSFDYKESGPTLIPANTGKEYIIFCYATYRSGGGNPSCTVTNGTLTLLASHGSDGSYSLPYKIYHFVKTSESTTSGISYSDIDSAFWLPIPTDMPIGEVTAENSLDLATATYTYSYTTDYCLVIYHLRDNGRHVEPRGMALRMLESEDMNELVAWSAEDATYSVQEWPVQAFIFSNDGSNVLNISSMYKDESTQRRNLILIPLGNTHSGGGGSAGTFLIKRQKFIGSGGTNSYVFDFIYGEGKRTNEICGEISKSTDGANTGYTIPANSGKRFLFFGCSGKWSDYLTDPRYISSITNGTATFLGWVKGKQSSGAGVIAYLIEVTDTTQDCVLAQAGDIKSYVRIADDAEFNGYAYNSNPYINTGVSEITIPKNSEDAILLILQNNAWSGLSINDSKSNLASITGAVAQKISKMTYSTYNMIEAFILHNQKQSDIHLTLAQTTYGIAFMYKAINFDPTRKKILYHLADSFQSWQAYLHDYVQNEHDVSCYVTFKDSNSGYEGFSFFIGDDFKDSSLVKIKMVLSTDKVVSGTNHAFGASIARSRTSASDYYRYYAGNDIFKDDTVDFSRDINDHNVYELSFTAFYGETYYLKISCANMWNTLATMTFHSIEVVEEDYYMNGQEIPN